MRQKSGNRKQCHCGFCGRRLVAPNPDVLLHRLRTHLRNCNEGRKKFALPDLPEATP